MRKLLDDASANAKKNWDAILALSLAWIALAIWVGPGYYFLVLWTLGSLYVLKVALETPGPPRRR